MEQRDCEEIRIPSPVHRRISYRKRTDRSQDEGRSDLQGIVVAAPGIRLAGLSEPGRTVRSNRPRKRSGSYRCLSCSDHGGDERNHGAKKNFEEIAFARIELGISEKEWEQSHPEQCNAYIKTWKNKMDRENASLASIKLVLCQSAGVKIGGRSPRLEDFLPRKKTAPSQALSKARLQVAAIQSQARSKK